LGRKIRGGPSSAQYNASQLQDKPAFHFLPLVGEKVRFPPVLHSRPKQISITRQEIVCSEARRMAKSGSITYLKEAKQMSITGLIQIAGVLTVASLFGPTIALAQTAPGSASMKTIGTPASAAKPEIVPSLFVLNSRGATLQGDVLTLTGVTPHSIIFADRPIRAAGHQLTADVIADWGSGEDSFSKNPPNATVSVFSKDGSVKDAVVVLKNPKLEGDKLTFNVQTLEGDLNGGDGAASVFIDIIGRPFTPLSFAGVARRSAFRGAMYAGAVGAAAYGAAAYAAPYAYAPPPYARPACGYYPYPPCY
jgi:hypothetical protein